MVKKEVFGRLPDGREVQIFTIENSFGEYVQLLDYGAAIQSIVVLDRNGHLDDVVLGAPNAESIPDCTYMAGTIGRYSGRVPEGKCVIEGTAWQLEKNVGNDYVHGASGNYAKKFFAYNVCAEENKVVFTLHDYGEGGFQNELDATVTYSFGDDHCLQLCIEMRANGTTIVNPTNHCYFNLGGAGTDARDLVLRIPTRMCTGKDASGAPNGTIRDASGSPADYTEPKTLRQAMSVNPGAYFTQQPAFYDEYYVFENTGVKLEAELVCTENGRRMQIYANGQGMVFYNPAGRAPEPGKNGAVYEGYPALCLQPGFVPNAINCPIFESPVLHKGECFRQFIHYSFGVTDRA